MSWSTTRLKYLAVTPITNGVGEPAEYDDPAWPRYVRMTDLAGPTTLRDDTFSSLPPEVAARAPLQRHDILMGAAGTIGKSFRYEDDGRACYAGYLVRFRAKPDVDPRFISYWMETPAYWRQIDAGKVISTIENFSAGKYRNLTIQVPAFESQRSIADFLDTETVRIDDLVAAKQRMIDLVTERFLAKVREVVTGGELLVDPLDVSPHEAEAHQRLPVRLSWRYRLGSGTTPPSGDPRYYGEGVPWVLTGDLRDAPVGPVEGSVTTTALSEFSALRVHSAGSLVVAMYGATIGRMGLLTGSAAVNQACCVLSPLHGDIPKFVFYWLLGFRQELVELGRGAGQPNISQTVIGAIRIAMPSSAEQELLVSELDVERVRALSLVEVLTKQIELLKEHRQALITAAVTGELEVA